jgi:hypothetical protein
MRAPPRPNLHLTLPKILMPGEVAKLFRVRVRTLETPEWDLRLQPFRTLGGHRRYRRENVADVLDWWFR